MLWVWYAPHIGTPESLADCALGGKLSRWHTLRAEPPERIPAMANISLNSYLHLVNEALQNYDSDEAARLLSFRDAHVASHNLRNPRPDQQCRRVLVPPYDEMVAAHIKCCYYVANHDFAEAYNQQAQADVQLVQRNRGKAGESLEKAAEQLMGLFRVCASDNRAAIEDSKKWGMLNLVNQLFKIYFKINKLHLCKPLIRAIESLPIKDKFSLSQLVTYRFYVGRKAMFDSDYKSAEEYLTFAFEKCHRDSHKNKRLILIYLIPVKMLLGSMPKSGLVRKYNLRQFLDVAQAVRSGNLLQLNEAMQKHEAFFIRCGIYLILEKLKIITYRNLFKKVYLIKDKNHLIDISSFTVALRMMGVEDIDDDETQCLLANLIFENKIKGYITHQHQKLVVSKQNPFPVLSTVL
ncbi:PCI domain-containing protein 2-like [Elysia marginata]|uniref:CSN12-like protein n=1 Tax=Elysia marginata TaxID=1093978 RepID=A0AAV4JBX6_9GAST|nr:PCI domain-containing protein 2-like [Elysia marginata]